MSSTATPNRYLLEIGTEELPAEFLESSVGELTEKVKATLSDEGIGFENVRVFSTPRRLALFIEGLPDVQATKTTVVKGPPTRIALDPQGNPTQAGLGFARKMNVDFSELKRESAEGEEYLVFNQTASGQPTQEILCKLLPDIILGLSGSHFMFWGSSTIKFSRPIRWLLSLWNQSHLPFQIGDIRSEAITRGHRILGESRIPVSDIDSYFKVLEEQGKVIADQDRRRQEIWAQIQQSAVKLGGTVPENQDLLDTVTNLVEYPSVVTGHFQERFLDIPKEVITTVMAAHQKYFPVEKGSGADAPLLPYFLTISNGCADSAETIRQGNERVLTARLEDARFFFDDDRKVSLESRVEALKGITFQKGLGTMYDKTQRLESLSEKIALGLKYAPDDVAKAKRSAKLAKTDLMTGMVRELTELQGVIGKKYSQLAGEDAEVCEALFEQYLPRFMGDAVASHKVGIVLTLADKLDTLIAVFSQKNARLPSGSKDPLGLRRMAAGIIQTVLENKIRINLVEMLGVAYEQLGSMANAEREQSLDLVYAFIQQRFKGALLEQNIRYDIIEAVLESKNPLEDLVDAVERVNHLKDISQKPETLKALYEPANRIGRILGDHYQPNLELTAVKSDLFRDPTEGKLLEVLQTVDSHAEYATFVHQLETLSPAVEAFFDKVLINDPDETVKQNRYNLLSLLNRLYLRLAKFSKLVV